MSEGSVNCLPLGTRLAEFEIKGVIGEGGFGIVYLAFDHSLQRTVAVKEYMPAALAARGVDHGVTVRSKRHEEAFEVGLRSFINEARLLAQFDHPSLVKVYRFWEQHGTAYMAQRYYEGHTFKHVVKETPGVVDEVWMKRVLKPILRALQVLYRANILHRDISPENIIIQPNGEPVLLDFGAARQIVSGMAQSLTVILKPGYAPVEQYADDESMKQGPWTDIYSLCAVMYSAIAQKAPPAAVARMLGDPMVPLADGDYPKFSQGFLAAIDKGLAVRPEDRPQTMAEFAQMLGLDKKSQGAAADTPAAAAAPGNGAKTGAKIGAKTGAATGARAVASNPAAGKPFAAGAVPRKHWMIGGAAAAVLLAGVAWLSSGPATAPAGASATDAPLAASSAPPSPAGASMLAASAASAASSPASPAALPATQSNPAQLAAKAAPAVAAASAPVNAAAELPKSGAVNIAVLPWATVYVDGVQKGVSPPLKKLTLTEGSHQVKIENPNFPAYEVKVTVDAKKAVTVKHDFQAN